jgi:RimJ/RimL family protein N-acetyltransferase
LRELPLEGVKQMIKLATSMYKIQQSNIQGRGTFASLDLTPGVNIGVAIMGRAKTVGQSPDHNFIRLHLGRYTNHSSNPNTSVKKTVNHKGRAVYFFVTKKPVKKGEEITVNYNEFDFPGKRDFAKTASAKQDVHKIYKQMPKSDREHLGPREYYDRAKTRHVYYDNRIPAGFGEVHQIQDKGYINLGVLPEYRGRGLSRMILSSLVAKHKDKAKHYRWTSHKDNTQSIGIARKYGFKVIGDDEREIKLQIARNKLKKKLGVK